MNKEKYIANFVVFAIIIVAWIIGFDFYQTYSLTKEGSEIDTNRRFFIIWEVIPEERISVNKKISANIEEYRKLLNAYDNIKSLWKYKYEVDEKIKQHYIIKPTIFDFYNWR